MKKTILLLFLICLSGCDNSDDKPKPKTELEKLPPATQTGANTIGCLVNGVPFTDSGLMNNYYQFVEGEYYLVINWKNGFGDNFKAGQISIRKTQIIEGESYLLNNNNSSMVDFIGGSANYLFSNNSIFGEYHTNSNHSGIVTFIRFDTQSGIMAGTFEFQAQELITGEIINITEGRFDLTFIQ